MAAGFGSFRRFHDVFLGTYKRPPREIRKCRAQVHGAVMDEVVLRLAYRPPYDWTRLHSFLAERAISGIEVTDNQGYARTVVTPNGWATIQVRQLDEEHALEFRVSGANPADLLQLSATARRVFDLAADPAMIALTLKDDSTLRSLISRRPGLRIPGVWDAFECAVRAIVGQQVSVSAGRTLAGRLVERAGKLISTPIDGLTHLFPTPAALIAADLGGLGLADGRIGAIKEVSTALVYGKLDFSGAVDEVTRKFTSIRGIGPWTAQYVAMRALGEPDAFPSADLVLRRAMSEGNGILSAPALEKVAEAWRPWRAYAAMYLWQGEGLAREHENETSRHHVPSGRATAV